jgi:hypothetical protein
VDNDQVDVRPAVLNTGFTVNDLLTVAWRGAAGGQGVHLPPGEDERDAADLADLLRMGRLAEAWIAPAEIRELREITRYRQLCRCRHSIRYAESRIMPMTGRMAWVPVVAGAESSA